MQMSNGIKHRAVAVSFKNVNFAVTLSCFQSWRQQQRTPARPGGRPAVSPAAALSLTLPRAQPSVMETSLPSTEQVRREPQGAFNAELIQKALYK